MSGREVRIFLGQIPTNTSHPPRPHPQFNSHATSVSSATTTPAIPFTSPLPPPPQPAATSAPSLLIRTNPRNPRRLPSLPIRPNPRPSPAKFPSPRIRVHQCPSVANNPSDFKSIYPPPLPRLTTLPPHPRLHLQQQRNLPRVNLPTSRLQIKKLPPINLRKRHPFTQPRRPFNLKRVAPNPARNQGPPQSQTRPPAYPPSAESASA